MALSNLHYTKLQKLMESSDNLIFLNLDKY